jgi:hypothetical protein
VKLAAFADEAGALLADFATELESLGVDVPDSVYVSPGILAWDGPSLTLYMSLFGQERPGFTEIPPAGVFRATLYVQILRVTAALMDDGDRYSVPNAEDIGTSGAQALSDASGLLRAAQAIHSKYLATGAGEQFIIQAVEPLGPEGGLAAVRIGIEVSLS